ncbi:MAG: anthranilate/aminodeoxychorismate synthase component II [Candidatus Magasanikbacteria bacterium CG10_big_fil_rev_8_21_14_0_10_40_10]|uniref:Anthranilate/aminodeoxychorismate synthase component II n=1 Tax=Candidatus Magasanikbacteria bacterium CG10_big_fil_rev_8_21_14_0_10_40_10 TaxID=1974648 RepID=A0A2M6W475_9BACT|nr:MAG: anthranilate/aminodeoxychorismate synthase component II [Candidatus Magasanikbacteria bacterium CG10_big_fil_rev_8_21_14_0_10_40_10]
MKILIIDNFDSFTFNLYQMVGKIMQTSGRNFELDVRRNNEITLDEIRQANYERIIISPGPGAPDDDKYFGVCADVLKELGRTIPTLGVCLGMQGLAYHYGGKIVRRAEPMHGKTSLIRHDNKGIFAGLPQGLRVMRYHSLLVDSSSLSDCLEITARVDDRTGQPDIMGLRHKQFPISGVQFHPESFATEGGRQILNNFLFNENI